MLILMFCMNDWDVCIVSFTHFSTLKYAHKFLLLCGFYVCKLFLLSLSLFLRDICTSFMYWSSPYQTPTLLLQETVVAVVPSYVKYRKNYYTKSFLTFSQKCIRLKGSPLHDRNITCSLEWPTTDILNIECQQCESVSLSDLSKWRLQD